MIGHTDKLCEKLFDNPQGQEEPRKYDSSLRAPIRNQSISRGNQWLRDAGGGRVIPAKEEFINEVPTEKGKDEGRLTKWRNEGRPLKESGGQSGNIVAPPMTCPFSCA